MQRLADDLVGDVRAVVVTRVDMVDAAFDRRAQHRDRAGAILRRSEDPFPGELHRAIADASDLVIAQT